MTMQILQWFWGWTHRCFEVVLGASLIVLVCMQEIAGPLESAVSTSALTPVSHEQQADKKLQLQLQPSLALWHALQRSAAAISCWAHCWLLY